MPCKTHYLQDENGGRASSYRFADPGENHRGAAVREPERGQSQRLFRRRHAG